MTQIDRLIEATINTVRLQGCICNPDIEVAGSDGFYSALIAHDDWCPLAPDTAKRGQPHGAVVVLPTKAGEVHA